MSTTETEASTHAAPSPATLTATATSHDSSTSRSWLRPLIFLAVIAAASGGGYYYLTAGGTRPLDVRHLVDSALQLVNPGKHKEATSGPVEVKERTPWDGLVKIDDPQARTLGLESVQVLAQKQPLRLELTGRTAYDPNSLAKVRARFDTLVEKVHAELGQLIHKGDALVDMNSVDLAAAKNDLQAKYVQWQRDLRVLKLHEALTVSGAVSQQTYIDDKNAENKSKLDYYQAREKLKILAVPDADVDPLIHNLGDLPNIGSPPEIIADKAKMTLRSRVDGIVIQREVVPGNYYDDMDVLMVIAPIDHLWVLANVYEVDQAKVAVGQQLEIRFPFLQQTLQATVEYVSSEVSRETRAVQIRASIPNLGGKLKSDMLVKVVLQIPPLKGQTVIPRLALVVINGTEYVFVKKNSGKSSTVGMFERRKVSVAQENSDFVVIASGLEAGEYVATSGSLMLAQLYEDLQMVDTGLPVE